MEVSQSLDLITTDPKVRSGRPCLAGTTVEVSAIAIATIVHGQSSEEIAADYNLSLSQVYAALSYYYDHKAEIDATIQKRRRLAQLMKEKRVGSRHPSLPG
jgi:uncharacterized protein (DUF433 family)